MSILSEKAASDLERGEGEWLNMQPVIRKAFKDNFDWLGSHQAAMEKLNHAFIKLSSKLESRVETSEVKNIMDKQISGALKKAAREDKTGDEIAKLSYELAKFNSLRVEIEKKVGKEEMAEQLRLKVDKTDTSIKQLFGNIVTKNMATMKEDLQTMRSKEIEANESKLGELAKSLKDGTEKMEKRLADVEDLKETLETIKNKFELYPSYSAIHSMLDRKADKSTLDTVLPRKADQQTFSDTMATVEKTLAEHEKSLTILKLRAELGSDGQSRTFRTTLGGGPIGEISPVNTSVKGEQERYMMGFTAGGDDSIMQVLPLSFRNDPTQTPGGANTTRKTDGKLGSASRGSAEEAAKRYSAQTEARRVASDSSYRAFNSVMSDMLRQGTKAATAAAGKEEPGRLQDTLSVGRTEAVLTAVWQRMNQMHDEIARLREENHYLHNKVVQVDNTQYAQHFDNIHNVEGKRTTEGAGVVPRRGESEGALDNDVHMYASKAHVEELRDAVAAESLRVDSLLVHTALVQRADEDLQGLKSKVSDYDLRIGSLVSSRDALDGKTQDLYSKVDHLSKRMHAHHDNHGKRLDSCSSAITKLSTESITNLSDTVEKLEKKINEIDFESMRAHTLEGNQQDRLRTRLNNLEKLTYSLETKMQANLGATEHINVTVAQPAASMPQPSSMGADVGSFAPPVPGTPLGQHHHLHPGSFQERYQRRSGGTAAAPSRIPSPVKHRSSNPALDMRLARLQREKEDLRRTIGLKFPSGAAQ